MFISPKWIHRLFQFHGKLSSLWGGELFLLRLRPVSLCNLNCPFCYVKKDFFEGPLLSRSNWDNIIKNLPKKTVVDITGGEPLLFRDFEFLFLKLRERKIKVSLMTNGTLLTEDLLLKFVTKKLYALLVSLDGPQKIHNCLRGEGTFEKVIKNLDHLEMIQKKLNSSWPRLTLKINVLEENISTIKDLIYFLEDRYKSVHFGLNLLFSNEARGGRSLASSLIDNRFKSGNQKMYSFSSEFFEQAMELDAFLKRRNKRYFWRPFFDEKKTRSFLKEYITDSIKAGPLNCSLPYNSLTLYGNGDVSPCDLSLKIGNISELNYDLNAFFSDKRYGLFLKTFYDEKVMKKSCQGCCLAKHEII